MTTPQMKMNIDGNFRALTLAPYSVSRVPRDRAHVCQFSVSVVARLLLAWVGFVARIPTSSPLKLRLRQGRRDWLRDQSGGAALFGGAGWREIGAATGAGVGGRGVCC